MKEILNVNNTEENLTNRAINRLNRQVKKIANDEKQRELDNKKHDLEIERIHKDNEKALATLKSDLEQQKLSAKINLMKARGRLEVLQAESKTKKADSLQAKGKYLNIFKYLLMFLSSFTSMLGFGMIESKLDVFPLLLAVRNGKYLNCVVIGVMFFIVQIIVSMFVATLDDISKFWRNPIYVILSLCIASMYIVSIYSNYGFWITLTSSNLVAGFYSFIIDLLGVLTSYYSDKFANLDSKLIYKYLSEETGNENIQTDLKNEQITEQAKTFITVEKPSFCMVSKTGKTEEKTDNKTGKNNITRAGKTAGKITKIQMQENINNLQDGTIVKPRLIGMTGNSNYKNWILEMNNVEKNENGEYIKKSNKLEVVK